MNCANCQLDLGSAKSRAAFICVEVNADEYIYSYWQCGACGFYTLETYRDRFSGEAAITVDGPIDREEGDAIVRYMRQCREPNNKRCRCDAHRWARGDAGYEPPPVAPSGGNGSGESPGPSNENPGPTNRDGAYRNSDPVLLTCPACGKRTDSLKRYGVMKEVIFLLVFARSRRCAYTACPKCMRGMLLKDTFSPVNILLANLMWLLVVLPYSLALLIASTIPGHSRSVIQSIQNS